MNLQPTLANEIITIKPIQKEDFEALFAIASDELLWEQHPNKDRYKKEVFQLFFENAIQSKGAFIVINNKTNEIIGSSRYYEFNEVEKSIVIGYTFISRAFWGKNYNSSLKELMINYAFQFVNKVYFHVGETNYRSQKAVEKLGAIKIGEIKSENLSKINWVYQLKK
ncbi:GNAT family N-acetyltransferase [Flavobacterium sp. N2270]|uniref:GNAT family N-acetyltransferase n=1 Tax=Flavobacterium sp. N2270 TaxID=2986831 RepID=UPI002223F697|nr:GNAT family N-acetyltransferase [Flavobacterium sp. N2270]